MKKMTFEQALAAIKAGARVRRQPWPRTDWIDAKTLDSVTISSSLLLADDWEIIPEHQPDPTIEELRRAIVMVGMLALRPGTAYSDEARAAIAPLRRPTDQ